MKKKKKKKKKKDYGSEFDVMSSGCLNAVSSQCARD